jgi:predicted nucleic acid-binding protein
LINTFVVDSWPILEWLRQREPARTRFLALVDSAERGDINLEMSRIIQGEVWYQVAKKWGFDVAPLYRARIANLPITVVSVDDNLVDEAADLKARFSISYADCFAAALAIRRGAAVASGDPDFLKLEAAGLLRVHWMGA